MQKPQEWQRKHHEAREGEHQISHLWYPSKVTVSSSNYLMQIVAGGIFLMQKNKKTQPPSSCTIRKKNHRYVISFQGGFL